MTAIGLVVSLVAGRDIRRPTGDVSVSNNHAKRRTAGCVLAGLTLANDMEVLIMPDSTEFADHIIDDVPDDSDAEFMNMTAIASG